MVRNYPTVAAVRSEPLQLFGPTAQPHRRFSDSRWRAVWIRSGAGLVWVAEQPIPLRPDSKRTRPGWEPGPGPAAASGGARAHARMCEHSSLLFACENSKYPKGTPFVLNFLYLYTTNFHPMVNVGLNAFSYLLVPFWL